MVVIPDLIRDNAPRSRVVPDQVRDDEAGGGSPHRLVDASACIISIAAFRQQRTQQRTDGNGASDQG